MLAELAVLLGGKAPEVALEVSVVRRPAEEEHAPHGPTGQPRPSAGHRHARATARVAPRATARVAAHAAGGAHAAVREGRRLLGYELLGRMRGLLRRGPSPGLPTPGLSQASARHGCPQRGVAHSCRAVARGVVVGGVRVGVVAVVVVVVRAATVGIALAALTFSRLAAATATATSAASRIAPPKALVPVSRLPLGSLLVEGGAGEGRLEPLVVLLELNLEPARVGTKPTEETCKARDEQQYRQGVRR